MLLVGALREQVNKLRVSNSETEKRLALLEQLMLGHIEAPKQH